MAELARLLGFMSSWDRQAVLAEYAKKIEYCPDPDKLVEMLGTPTKVAIDLAQNYVPTPPPAPIGQSAPAETEEAPAGAAEPPAPTGDAESPAPAAETVPAPAAETVPAPAAEPPAPAAAEPPRQPVKKPLRPFGVVLCVLLGLLLALPVALLALCLGIPFLTAGVGLVGALVSFLLHTVPQLGLISDILLVSGCGLVGTGLGLLLAAFGLWLSLTLAVLWIEKVMLPVGRRLARGKEAAE
jgi:hypothetical protein